MFLIKTTTSLESRFIGLVHRSRLQAVSCKTEAPTKQFFEAAVLIRLQMKNGTGCLDKPSCSSCQDNPMVLFICAAFAIPPCKDSFRIVLHMQKFLSPSYMWHPRKEHNSVPGWARSCPRSRSCCGWLKARRRSPSSRLRAAQHAFTVALRQMLRRCPRLAAGAPD